jgi:Lactate racemase N-terminal domain
VQPLVSTGGATASISGDELRHRIDGAADDVVIPAPPRRVLVVPPDSSRGRSRAGEITALLFGRLTASGCDTYVLPAIGTHHPMTGDEVSRLFHGRVPAARVLAHRWREDLVHLGDIPADEVRAVSGARVGQAIPVLVSRHLVDDWDLVISVGQVVPHEVVGMANFTKNLVIGLGGADTIHRTHYLGALCGMETIMGRARTPVREVIDAAFDRFIAPRLKVLWIMTVIEDTGGEVVQRGLFIGRGGSTDSGGAAYIAAARLSAVCNITVVPERLQRVACWLDPAEFGSTWLGNKAIYRTRMALADGAELSVLAPGVGRFGEDPDTDGLIRAHGYHGTAATLRAVDADPGLARNLGAAAHLVHGSSEGRFRIVYCTDPERGGLSRREVEDAGYGWRHLADEIDRLQVDGATPTGERVDRTGTPFLFVANPALGLWTDARSTAPLPRRTRRPPAPPCR